MSNIKYFALAGQGDPVHKSVEPEDARVNAVWMDGSVVEGCMFNEMSWYVKSCREPGLIKHNSDKVMFFLGSDFEDPENLNASVELWIENDKLTLTKTCAVFVPEGAAHGNIQVENLKKPFLNYACHLNTSGYQTLPAKAKAAPGTYAGYSVERFERPDGTLPLAPEGFLRFLVFLDGKRLKGAPYAEAVWFLTTNDTGPAPHTHENFDEFIGFIGSDPEHPDALNAEIDFYIEDEKITVTKSCLVYIPRGLTHSPIYVPKLQRPIIHFSGGNGGDYARGGGEHRDDNLFKM